MPLRAGVSSFGIGGTNAHVVLEEAPTRPDRSPASPSSNQVLVLSARSAGALDALTTHLAAHLDTNPQLDLADVAYTLQVGRTAFEHRRAIVCSSLEEAAGLLSARAGDAQAVARSPAFVFSPANARAGDMGRDLYRIQPTFRAQVDACWAG